MFLAQFTGCQQSTSGKRCCLKLGFCDKANKDKCKIALHSMEKAYS
jgi:hypothetical protein